MNRRLEIIRIMNNCLIIYVVYVVFMIGFGTPRGGALFVGSLPLVVMLLGAELVQAFVSNLVLFLLAHILMIAATSYVIYSAFDRLLVGVAVDGVPMSIIGTVIGVLFMLIVTVIGIYTRLDGKSRFYPEIFEGAIFILLFIFCRITKVRQAEAIVLVAEMIWGVMAVCFYNARQTVGALVTYHEGDFVPYDQIRRNNSVMLRISLGITIVLMLLCSLFDYGKEILSALRAAIVRFLTWLFSHFDFETPVEEELPPAEPVSGGMQGLLPEDYVDDSIWHKIWDALFWIVAAAVTIIFIILLVKVIKEFYKIFNNSRKGIRDRLSRDKREFLNPLSDKEDRAGEGNRSSKLRLRERLTKRGNIRWLFIRYIKGGRGFSDIRPGFAPSQMEKTSLGKEASAYELYEKARYSSLEITSEDVDRMKSLTK